MKSNILFLLLLNIFIVPVVLAQDEAITTTLEEVVVKAQAINKSLQDVPISTTVINGSTVKDRNLFNLTELSNKVPGLVISDSAIGGIISIRGISSGLNPSFEQSVATFVDNIYLSRVEMAKVPLFDIDQVEVLRGPQSILFERSTIGGAIVVNSKRPNLDGYSGDLLLKYSPETNLTGYEFSNNVPLTEDTAMRVSLYNQDSDGYIKNTFLDTDTPSNESDAIRVSILNDFDEYNQFYVKLENNRFYTSNPSIEIINEVTNQGGRSYVEAVDLLSNTKIDTIQDDIVAQSESYSNNDVDTALFEWNHSNEKFDLIANASYNNFTNETLCDCDFTENTDFQTESTEKFRQIALQLLLEFELATNLDARVGANIFQSEQSYEEYFTLLKGSTISKALVANNQLTSNFVTQLEGAKSNRSFEQDHSTVSIFGDFNYKLNAQIDINFGIRFSNENKAASKSQVHINNLDLRLPANTDNLASLGLDATNTMLVAGAVQLHNGFLANFMVEPYSKVERSLSDNFILPSFKIKHKANDRSMVYISYVSAYKVGGFDLRSNAHPDVSVNNAMFNVPGSSPTVQAPITGSFRFDEETVDNFELGYKTKSSNQRFEFNASIYQTTFSGLQTSEYDGVFGFNVQNVGSADIKGLEIDSRFIATENLILSMQYAFNDFSYKDYPTALCHFNETPTNGTFCNRTGSTRELAPQNTGHLNIAYSIDMGLLDVILDFDVENSSGYHASQSLDPNLYQSGFNKFDLGVSIFTKDQWQVRVQFNNITNERVLNFGNQQPLSTVYTNNAGVAYYGIYNQPRSMSLQYKMSL